MKPEDRKRLKRHIEMIVEHKEPTHSQTEKILRDACEEQIKGRLELEDKNRKLRAELNALRVKTSQQERFIWWIWNVYSRNVNDLIYAIMGATTFDTEGEAKEGKYALPKRCFDLMKLIDEYTEHIYDGTYLDVEMSVGVKNTNPDYHNPDYYNRTKTSTDNNKCMWVMVEDPDIDLWCTSCGEEFHLEADTPSDNHMKYCCYCGKEIAEGE